MLSTKEIITRIGERLSEKNHTEMELHQQTDEGTNIVFINFAFMNFPLLILAPSKLALCNSESEKLTFCNLASVKIVFCNIT